MEARACILHPTPYIVARVCVVGIEPGFRCSALRRVKCQEQQELRIVVPLRHARRMFASVKSAQEAAQLRIYAAVEHPIQPTVQNKETLSITFTWGSSSHCQKYTTVYNVFVLTCSFRTSLHWS